MPMLCNLYGGNPLNGVPCFWGVWGWGIFPFSCIKLNRNHLKTIAENVIKLV